MSRGFSAYFLPRSARSSSSASTGLLLFAYMVLHLAGNVLIFAGREIFNEYSHKLISNPLIIPIEIGLLLVFLLHIYKTVTMWMANQAARPVGYQKKALAGHTSRKSLASSTMIASGLIVLVFVSSTSSSSSSAPSTRRSAQRPIRDLYRTEIEVFRNPLWVGFYVIGTLLVGLHLRHGIASGFQSLGFDHPLYTRRLTIIGIVLAVVIGGGLGIIPVWVYLTH